MNSYVLATTKESDEGRPRKPEAINGGSSRFRATRTRRSAGELKSQPRAASMVEFGACQPETARNRVQQLPDGAGRRSGSKIDAALQN
ncbi:MAG: hypothetical protein ACXW29_13535 [Thermoanaerobaculia bacterium]